MWNFIKRGFGYGLGGRIGWELGGLLWTWARRLILLVVAWAVVQCNGNPVTAYQDYKAKHSQVQKVMVSSTRSY